MSESYLTASAFASQDSDRAQPYIIDPLAPRATVNAAQKVTAAIGKNAKAAQANPPKTRLAVVRENAEGAQTGMPLEVVGAVIRSAGNPDSGSQVIPLGVILDLLAEGAGSREDLFERVAEYLGQEQEQPQSEEVPA